MGQTNEFAASLLIARQAASNITYNQDIYTTKGDQPSD
jgi:hypothetical protein